MSIAIIAILSLLQSPENLQCSGLSTSHPPYLSSAASEPHRLPAFLLCLSYRWICRAVPVKSINGNKQLPSTPIVIYRGIARFPLLSHGLFVIHSECNINILLNVELSELKAIRKRLQGQVHGHPKSYILEPIEKAYATSN